MQLDLYLQGHFKNWKHAKSMTHLHLSNSQNTDLRLYKKQKQKQNRIFLEPICHLYNDNKKYWYCDIKSDTL